jgi:hypothetical protein
VQIVVLFHSIGTKSALFDFLSLLLHSKAEKLKIPHELLVGDDMIHVQKMASPSLSLQDPPPSWRQVAVGLELEMDRLRHGEAALRWNPHAACLEVVPLPK